jgi:hypothetical protein
MVFRILGEENFDRQPAAFLGLAQNAQTLCEKQAFDTAMLLVAQ